MSFFVILIDHWFVADFEISEPNLQLELSTTIFHLLVRFVTLLPCPPWRSRWWNARILAAMLAALKLNYKHVRDVKSLGSMSPKSIFNASRLVHPRPPNPSCSRNCQKSHWKVRVVLQSLWFCSYHVKSDPQGNMQQEYGSRGSSRIHLQSQQFDPASRRYNSCDLHSFRSLNRSICYYFARYDIEGAR